MPVFESRTVLEIARGVKAFVSLRTGVTRAREVFGPAGRDGEREIAELRRQLEEARRRIEALRAGPDGGRVGKARPENLIWIFGTARVGSTWLASMMGELENHEMWNEPLVGELFGHLYYVRSGNRRGRHFILGDRYKESWQRTIRSMVLEGAEDRFARAAREGYVVVKEPNGSIGSPLLMEALPESRMILLVRDPRDVVASSMDAVKKGSWYHENQSTRGSRDRIPSDERTFFVSAAKKYLRQVGSARQAYESHSGPKALVRYEELRADAMGEMRRLYERLGIAVDEGELRRAVRKHSWESIPEGEKGEGKFYRKATPGSWREDLTEEQIRTVEEVTAPLLREFYS